MQEIRSTFAGGNGVGVVWFCLFVWGLAEGDDAYEPAGLLATSSILLN